MFIGPRTAKWESIAQCVKYCPYHLLPPLCMIVQFIQGRYSGSESWNILLNLPQMVWHCCRSRKCSFQRASLRAAWPAGVLAEVMKNYPCLLSLFPCHSLPCLAAAPPLATEDPRNPWAGGSYWSHRQSQSHHAHTHVGWLQAPGEEVGSWEFTSVHSVHLT